MTRPRPDTAETKNRLYRAAGTRAECLNAPDELRKSPTARHFAKRGALFCFRTMRPTTE